MGRAAIGKVVAVDRGDDHVAQAHVTNGGSQLGRLLRVGRLGPAVGHVAEGATAGADLAQHHEGGGALGEALVDVGARGFLAHRHQGVGAQLLLEALDLVADRDAHPDPRRLAQERRLRVEGHRIARDLVPGLLLGAGNEAAVGVDDGDGDGLGTGLGAHGGSGGAGLDRRQLRDLDRRQSELAPQGRDQRRLDVGEACRPAQV